MEIRACTFCVIRIFKCTLFVFIYYAYVYNVLHFILNQSINQTVELLKQVTTISVNSLYN